MTERHTETSLSAWTPGPWAQDGGILSGDPKLNELYIAIDADRDEDCRLIASTWGGAAVANADLIALAPELAAAVLAYQQLAEDGDSVSDCSQQMHDLAARLRQIGSGR